MPEPILDPYYWRNRLLNTDEVDLHRAIYITDRPNWEAIAAKHRRILAYKIGAHDSILDAGCGWGRLLTLLPPTWCGAYLGVDISPDFIRMARDRNPAECFLCANLLEPPTWDGPYDWAVLISIRPMVIRNLGQEAWNTMEANLRKVANKLLYLEYDVNDEGSVE